MSTITRPEISESNKYYINRHRYYELKHFCMQYDYFKKEKMQQNLNLLEKACEETDVILGKYVLMAVIGGYSYDILRVRCNVPCCRDIYYELYRRFFWVLDSLRD